MEGFSGTALSTFAKDCPPVAPRDGRDTCFSLVAEFDETDPNAEGFLTLDTIVRHFSGGRLDSTLRLRTTTAVFRGTNSVHRVTFKRAFTYSNAGNLMKLEVFDRADSVGNGSRFSRAMFPHNPSQYLS